MRFLCARSSNEDSKRVLHPIVMCGIAHTPRAGAGPDEHFNPKGCDDAQHGSIYHRLMGRIGKSTYLITGFVVHGHSSLSTFSSCLICVL